MRKLSSRNLRHCIRRSRQERKRRQRRSVPHRNELRQEAYAQFLQDRRMVPAGVVDYEATPGKCVIRPPADLSLSRNYAETIAFILNVRNASFEGCRRHPLTGEKLTLYVDFAAIRTIGPAAGLMLAAEMDRLRLSTSRKLRSLDREWHPPVKKFFIQTRLFALLGVQLQEIPEDALEDLPRIETLPFIRGRSVRGEKGSHIRDSLENLCGRSIGPRVTVYDAIVEAIANTRHAYPAEAKIWPARSAGRWWASGTWNSASDVVSVQMYDHGVGIPSTLPRSEHWSDIIKFASLGDRLHPEGRDYKLISAALVVGRTSTGQQGRGKGLAEMMAWIDKIGRGFLRITSGYGTVTYSAGGNVSGMEQKVPFPGTMIEWEVAVGE